MGTIKNENDMDLTEAEDIKKGWQEYTEELYKKDLHDPDNHDGVITHLEPDILECLSVVDWKYEISLLVLSKSHKNDSKDIKALTHQGEVTRRGNSRMMSEKHWMIKSWWKCGYWCKTEKLRAHVLEEGLCWLSLPAEFEKA